MTKRYLRFYFLGQLYQFNCMCFGLNIAPFVFTKLIKPIVTSLRTQGFPSIAHLDDFLLSGRNNNECLKNVNTTVSLLEKLGFLINYSKSCLTPTRTMQFLGFIYDSVAMTIGVPNNKQKYIVQLVSDFLLRDHCQIREFAHLVGVLVSVCPATRYGWVYTKRLERAKFLALQKSRGNFNRQMQIDNYVKEDLTWWKSNIINSSCPIYRYSFLCTIFTDASRTGWGAVCGSHKARGSWNDKKNSAY